MLVVCMASFVLCPGWLSRSIADKLATFNNLTGASMAKPIVCLVTPADPNDQTSKSRDAFEHELSNVGWSSPSIEFHAYYGYYDKKLLKAVADKAVKKAEAAIKAGQPAAIVAAGVVATTILQGMTKSVPIIQAVGGSKPSMPAKNVTGFYFDAIQTSKDQLDKLSGNDEVTVLYDSTNAPSKAAWKPYNHMRSRNILS
jgi:hypothetical protein